MSPKLYGTIASPPVRAVLLTAKAIDLELDYINVDLLNGDNKKPEFAKLNPLLTVPVLDDDGFVLVDSHAITAYLVERYAKDKSLYPSDVKKRALINQVLHFDSGTIFARHLRAVRPVVLGDAKVINADHLKDVFQAYGYAELLLQNKKYFAGDSLSIADFSVITTLSNSVGYAPLDEDKHPNITAWKKTLEALPYYDINKRGYEAFHALVKEKLSQ